jgi:hypothetical protein
MVRLTISPISHPFVCENGGAKVLHGSGGIMLLRAA